MVTFFPRYAIKKTIRQEGCVILKSFLSLSKNIHENLEAIVQCTTMYIT